MPKAYNLIPPMHYTILGRTGFRVSRMGLGCGGHSRLGLRTGTFENAARIVREAFELGVNFFDTAESYGTEEAVSQGLEGIPRDQVVLSTKVGATGEEGNVTPEQLRTRLEGCLARLQTEYVDVFHLHGVLSSDYAYAREVLVPEMIKFKEEGKIRAIGITEAFIPEPDHRMLVPGLAEDDCWDVVMLGFSLLNQSARQTVLPLTQAKGIGTLCMFAVRRALSQPAVLIELMQGLVKDGVINASEFDPADPLAFLTNDEVAESLQEAAYRYCLWEPGIDVVLSGTGNIDHLRQNVDFLSRNPLPEEVLNRLANLFANVDSVSGN